MAQKRNDDYEIRREHLKGLSDEELKARFFALAEEIVAPLVTLSQENTTPSVERSVLLRMGFSSLEAKVLTDFCLDRGLLNRGAGHVVLRVAQELGRPYRDVGREMAEGQHGDLAVRLFLGGGK